jgi:uncharacterized membrane protein YccC
LLFGLRLWASVCLALAIAFWLELDNPSWAGTSAAIVSLPSLGASLRKGSFRIIGTVIGAIFSVLLTSLFPQDRVGFLLGLAFWCAFCGFFTIVLRNVSAYAAALAGYTAMIIASDALGATGGVSGDVFILAVMRASEICIGIICSGIVLAGTGFGNARRRLIQQQTSLAAEIAGQFAKSFSLPGPEQAETRLVRRDIAKRVIALSPLIDEAMGESYDLRYRSRGLQTGMGGLLTALTGWRTVANCLENLPQSQSRKDAEKIIEALPQDLRSAWEQVSASSCAAEPLKWRHDYRKTARALLALPTDDPALRLVADAAAETSLGLSRTLNGVAFLVDPGREAPRGLVFRLRPPDLLPAFISAARVFAIVVAVELFWIITVWPSGAEALTFAAVGVLLLAAQSERAYQAALSFTVAFCVLVVLAGIVNFAILPAVPTFLGFCLVLGGVLVPAAALSALPRYGMVFQTIAWLFIPVLGPANRMTFDTMAFYNSAMAIVLGTGVSALGFLLIPSPHSALQARRIMALTLRDFRRLAAGLIPSVAADWEGRLYSRLSVLPAQTEPLQFARAVATLSMGTEIIELRRAARWLSLDAEFSEAFDEIAHGNSSSAIERFAEIDRRLAELPVTGKNRLARLRARGSIRAISEALNQHRAYFDSGSS